MEPTSQNDKKRIQILKYNTKLYPIYKMFACDLLFYYSITFLYLTQTKGMSASAVLFTDAFYPIFKFFLQIPCAALVTRLGNRTSTILGNVLVAISIALLLPANGIGIVIVSQFFSALGFALKALTETNLLYDSIPKSPRRNDLFSLIDGKGLSYYYYLDAIASVLTGFLFVVNGYLPMMICFAFCIFAIYLACKFKETKQPSQNHLTQKTTSIRDTFSDLRQAFTFIFRSRRLKDLILYYALMSSILAVLTSLRSSILTDIDLPEQYFGVVFAILGIISGIASAQSGWFHKRFRNHTLKHFGMTMVLSMILIGFCVILPFNFGTTLTILLFFFTIQYIIKGPFYTLIKRYLNSFSTRTMRPKILAAADLIYSIIRAILAMLASFLLGFTTTAYTFVILGCLCTAAITLLLDHMRHTVGLKPEQYSKKDISFTEVH